MTSILTRKNYPKYVNDEIIHKIYFQSLATLSNICGKSIKLASLSKISLGSIPSLQKFSALNNVHKSNFLM